MNYIAHIHLAHASNTSLVGNFLGDFVKGSDLSYLAPQVRQGVMMHRRIDSFTDSHSLTSSVRKMFPNNIRRMSGVILDIYFDHLLCKFWDDYNSLSFDHVIEIFYAELAEIQIKTDRFSRVRQSLLDHKWLSKYQKRSAHQQAFRHIESRLNNKICFADSATDFINANERQLTSVFKSFYPIVIDYAKTLAQNEITNDALSR